MGEGASGQRVARAQSYGWRCLQCPDGRACEVRVDEETGSGGGAHEFLSRPAEYRCMCLTGPSAPSRQEQGRKWAVTQSCWPHKQVPESAWALCLHHRPCLGDRIRGPGHDRENAADPILISVPVTPAVGKPLSPSSRASIRGCSKKGGHLTQHPWVTQGAVGSV